MEVFGEINVDTLVEKVIKQWENDVGIYERKTPNENIPYENPTVKEFATLIVGLRENVRRSTGGNAEFEGGNLHWVCSVPYHLEKMMCEYFGTNWKQEPSVWKSFKRKFKIGMLNPKSQA